MSRFLYALCTSALVIALAIPFSAKQACADSESVLYAFERPIHDGRWPEGGLIADKNGNLYGTTSIAGRRYGTVFKITPDGSETVVHYFRAAPDGATPLGKLLLDAAGNLYGTTSAGGDSDWGTVFRIAPDGTETILYAFKDGHDGQRPQGELIMDKNGNLYGTTDGGGTKNWGTVFKLAPDGTETVLYSFKGPGGDGGFPDAGLWADANGNLYGTTLQGGPSGNAGTVFKLSPSGTETVLHYFTHSDGASPNATLVPDGKGNLYGTAYGGTGDCNSGYGCGVIFKIASDGTFSVMYTFPNAKAGDGPVGLLIGKDGLLYGSTVAGGDFNQGVTYKLTPDGIETVLHSFGAQSEDGSFPRGQLVADAKFKHLFGATREGGNNRGVVYVIRP